MTTRVRALVNIPELNAQEEGELEDDKRAQGLASGGLVELLDNQPTGQQKSATDGQTQTADTPKAKAAGKKDDPPEGT